MRLFYFILISITLSSCIHKHVHKSFRQYSPYKTNDILVFQNTTTSKVDTIFLTTVKDFSESDGPVPHFINRHTYVCGGYTSDFQKNINLNPREWTQLIEIVPNYGPGPVRPRTNGIYFKLNTKSFKLFYFVPLDTLNKKNLQTLTVNGKNFTDVYEFNIPYDSEFAFRGNVTKFFWSKTNGFLTLTTDKKEQILLIQKTNDIKTIDIINRSEKYKSDNWRK